MLPDAQTVGPAQPLPAHCPNLDCVDPPEVLVVVACEVVVKVVDVTAGLDEEEVEVVFVELELDFELLLVWVDAVDDEDEGAVPWTHCQ